MSPEGMRREEAIELVYFERWADPVAEEILRSAPRLRLTRLTRDDPPEKVWAALTSAHGYQISSARSNANYPVDKELLARCPRLVAVSTQGAGFDTVDVRACTEAGLIAVNQTGLNKQAVAEHVVGMMLALSKRMIQSDRALRRDRSWTRLDYQGDDIQGKTIGIVGIGNIGTRLAAICRAGFGMTVLACDPYVDAREVARRGAEKVTLDELLRRADFVSINCPLTTETRAMIGAAQYGAMKPSAYFINTARGGIHDETALAEALRGGRLAGAGLDVWAEEPPPLDHPLLGFDNVIVTPHNAGVTRQAYREMAEGAARQWLAILAGERPPRLLNPEAWPAYRKRFAGILGGTPVA
ncbi:MAG TPA: hydroxyacid dehydrogenase [Alphaproteobacteria bacterium]|nr:hydroxyacid dehydrogenase [Alphaproteobacteria bacterium]